MINQSILYNILIPDFTWVLADFGAEVVEVQPLVPEAEGKFSRGYYNTWNRNKLR